jgi:hypothetical protein
MPVLNLPDQYSISKRVSELPDEELCKLIEIGEYIYFNGNNLYLNHENEKFVFALDKQIEEIRRGSDIQIKNHADVIRTQYDKIVDGKNDLIMSKQMEIDDLKERIKILEDENCQALTLSNKLDSLMGKGNSVDNAMKGDFGESIVSSQIQYWYPTCEIEDTSADTAKGDLLWKMNDNEFKALVEVKNVQIVRPTEIQKFERDMIINIKDDLCNCGLFVSIKTETIPNKGKFKLEFINNCPIIYVSNVLGDLNTLRFALDSLLLIQQKMKKNSTVSHSDDEDEAFYDDIIEFVQTQYNKLEQLKSGITTMKTTVQTLSSCISMHEKSVIDLIKTITNLKDQHDIFKQVEREYKANSKEELKESILRDMRQFQKNNGRIPALNDMTSKYKISIFRDELAYKKLKKELVTK